HEEAESGCKSVYHACQQPVSALYVREGDAEYRTVCRDQRKVYAERIVERRHGFLQEHFHKLHQSRDDEDKYDCIQIIKLAAHDVGIPEDKLVNQPGYKGSDRNNEYDCCAHAGCRFCIL